MKPKVLFIGSIGVVAETSELQRQSYNQAMAENDVAWEWNQEVYRELLKSNGGKDRLHTLSAATGQNLNEDLIQKIHTRKTELAGKKIMDQEVNPRPGLENLIRQAKENNTQIAWVTTTGEENTNSILQAFQGKISKEDFDHIFHREDAENGKPSPDIYQAALKHFDVSASECIAIEDSLNSVLAAKGAGIFTVATLGNYHDEHVENIADLVLESLAQTDYDQLVKSFENSKTFDHVA